ncbi:hypothetical protein IAT38_005169 [Cryptococcus sp. DSM 104549]
MVFVQNRAPLTVSFSNNVTSAADFPIASSSSSPLVPSSSSPSRPGQVVPLGSARTVALSRRAVIFSPSNHTKYFHSDDTIIQSTSTPLQPTPAQKVYPASDPVTPRGDSPSLGSQLSESSSAVRSILKSRAHQIRVAASVEEGTLNNREAARLIVSGKRPGIIARDSFDLAMIRNAAAEGTPSKKGKERMPGEVPSSDENVPSTGDASSDKQLQGGAAEEDAGSEEEEEEMEQDGALATGSLIDIILNGAENLLTLEEAYNTLSLRLRERIPTGPYSDSLPPDALDNIRVTTQPIRDEAPAMVRAVQRDIHRLLGKFPSSEAAAHGLTSSSPFKELKPLADVDRRDRFTPSPTPQPSNARGGSSSPTKSPRQGYTESEIRYRRESSGVGAAVLRLLAFIFHSPHLYKCFSQADLQSLLDQVLAITRTLRLPTPNPKKTYFLSVIVLTQMRLPVECVAPIKDKVVRAVARAVADDFRTKNGGPEKQGPSGIKKEGFHAVSNILNTYPVLFFPFYADLIPGCLRGLHNSTGVTKYSAAAALGAYIRAKHTFIEHALSDSPAESWGPAKSVVAKSEFFVISHLKSAILVPGGGMVYNKTGEKRTEWMLVESVLKEGVGAAADVHWACGVWATLVTMMGAAYMSSGLTSAVDNIMDRSLRVTVNTTRPLLARMAWNHNIHAYLSANMTTTISDDGRVIRSYNPFAAMPSADGTILDTLLIPFKNAMDETNKAGSVEKAYRTLKSGGVRGHWKRSEKSKRLQWAVTCSQLSTAILYAYTGAAIFHEDAPAKARAALSGLPSSDGPATVELTRDEKILPRIDSLLRNVLQPIIRSLCAVRGVDKMVIQAWDILEAITSSISEDWQAPWSLNTLISTGYLGGEAFDADKDADIPGLLTHFEMNGLTVADIPSWGKFNVSRRIRWLLGFFDEALTSVKHLNSDQAVQWVKDDEGHPVIPVPLSNLWVNLLGSLEALKPVAEEPALPYFAALAMVTNKLLEIIVRPGPPCLPMCFFDENAQCVINEDRVKIALVSHLFARADEVLGGNELGAVLGVCRLGTDNQQLGLNAYQSTAFDVNDGHLATPVGLVLGVLLRTSVLKEPQDHETQAAFMTLVRKVVDVGLASQPGYWKMFLGDITKASPFLMMDCEEINLDLWRMIATKWIERIKSDGSAAPTNTTGDLLVSLLSDPFRSARIDSPWYHLATEDDLEIWRELLRITMERFRVKRVGVNFGLLETMAAHLTDHLEQGDRTISATITLHCLASAASCISFSPLARGNNHSPWHAHDNYVPVDFLTLVNQALETSYSSAQSQAVRCEASPSSEETPQTLGNVSPGVGHLLEALGEVLQKAPGEFVGAVLREVESGLLLWLADAGEMATEEMKAKLDTLQGGLLKTLTEAVTTRQLPVDSALITKATAIFTSRRASFQTQTDFITHADALLEQTYDQTGPGVMDAVGELLGPLESVCEEIPLEKVGEVLLPVRDGMAMWLRDEKRILSEDMVEKLNKFYLVLLTIFAESISHNHILADSNSVNALLDIYASRASYRVRAFCDFWSMTYGSVEGLEYSEDVKAFLRDMLDVQPGLIDVPGLSLLPESSQEFNSLSQTQSQSQVQAETQPEPQAPSPAQSPIGAQTRSRTKSLSLPRPASTLTQAQEVTEIEMDDELLAMTSVEYDADASQSQSQLQTYETQPEPASPADFVPLEETISSASGSGSPTAAGEAEGEEDVFGPAAMTKTRGRKKGKGKKAVAARARGKGKRALAAVEEEAEAPATKRRRTNSNSSSQSPGGSADEPILVDASDDEDDCIVLDSLPEQAAPKEAVPPPTVKEEPGVVGAAPADTTVAAEAEPESIESTDVDEPKEAAARYVSPSPPPVPQTAPGSQQKGGSLLISASRWLSRVPTFFSPAPLSPRHQSPAPAPPAAEPVQTPVAVKPAVSVPDSFDAGSPEQSETSSASAEPKTAKKPRKKKAGSAQKETQKRPRSPASIGSEGKRKTKPVVEVTSRSPRSSRNSSRASSIASFASGSESRAAATKAKGKGKAASQVKTIVVDDDEEEDEDELLLSPESARRRKREEEREINEMVTQVGETQQQWNESVSGRFDDAPNDPSSFRASPSLRHGKAVPAINPSPARRTAQQSRILSMLDEAAKGRNVIATLDHEGMKDLMKSLNLLRDAAENRLVSRVDEMRRR